MERCKDTRKLPSFLDFKAYMELDHLLRPPTPPTMLYFIQTLFSWTVLSVRHSASVLTAILTWRLWWTSGHTSHLRLRVAREPDRLWKSCWTHLSGKPTSTNSFPVLTRGVPSFGETFSCSQRNSSHFPNNNGQTGFGHRGKSCWERALI